MIGRAQFGRTVGLLAGLGAATYWLLVYYTGELLIPTLITFLDVLLVGMLLRASARPGRLSWGLCGIVLALSALGRPDILLFAPVVLGWIVLQYRTQRRNLIGYAAAFTLGCLIPVLPVTVRNYVVGHDRVLIASQGGVNLYIGNNPGADGFNVILPGTRAHWHEGYLDQIAIAERAEGRKLKPSEVSDFYVRQTWHFVTDQPLPALRLFFQKLKYFWNGYEFANEKDMYEYTARYTSIVRYLPLGFGLVAPLGLLGIFVTWPQRRRHFPLWGFVLTYMTAVALFFVSARFRVPVLPMVLVYAAAACTWLVRTARDRRWRSLAEAAIVLGLLAVWSNATQPWRSAPGSWDATTAALLAEQGKITEAIAAYQRLAAEDPNQPGPNEELAALYLTQGDLPAAERHARRAVELNPNGARGHDVLGAILAHTGRLDEALRCFQRSVELLPHQADSRQHLGDALLMRGRPAEAAVQLLEADRLQPGRADTLASLGFVAAQQGDAATAVERFRRSLAVNPADARVYAEWARVLQAQGRLGDAGAVLRDGLRQAPDNPALALHLAGILLASPDPTVRDPAEAVRLAEGVSRRSAAPDVRTRYTLAAAYAAAGRCPEAVREAQQAIPLAQQAGLMPIVQQLRMLVDQCNSGQPLDIRAAPTTGP